MGKSYLEKSKASNRNFGNFRRAIPAVTDYANLMNNDWRARLRERMNKLGYTDATLRKAAGLGVSVIYDMLERGKKGPRLDTIQAVAKVLGMSLAELIEGEIRPPVKVPVVGELDKGEEWRQYDFRGKIPDTFDLPTAEDDLISVRVLSNNMAPRYQQGDVLIGSRIWSENADNYIGLPVIVKTQDERTYVKVLTRGSKENTYTLRSYDPSVPDIADVSLLWFAPVVAIMPHTS